MARRRRRRRNKEPLMGRLLTTAGLALKTLQIIGAAFSLNALSGTVLTLITTCLLVGGLAVIAAERMSIVSAFALISLVGIIGTVLPSSNTVFPFIFLSASFLSYAVMLITMKKTGRIAAGIAVIALTALCILHIAQIVQLQSTVITVALVLVYVIMGAGLYF